MHGVYEVERIDLRPFAYAAAGSSGHRPGQRDFAVCRQVDEFLSGI
jgi:hypothetical protein